MHRIGIVGCGGIARVHVEGYRAVLDGRAEVVAGCDPDEATLAAFCDRYEIPHRFTDPVALLDSGEVDVVALLTPPAVRGDVIFPACDAGVHLLVEKPFAESLGDAIGFVDAAEDAGIVLAVNQQTRFMPDILRIREILERGKIGEMRFIAHDQYQNRTRVRGWRADEERLEISIYSIHLLDRIRSLVGRPPEAVSCVTRAWNPDVRGETFTALTIQFEGGVVGTMRSNWHSLGLTVCPLRIDGTAGSLESTKTMMVGDTWTLTVERPGRSRETYSGTLENAIRIAMGESMGRLLAAIDGETEPPHSGRDNLETMAIVDAAYLSAARDGARVEIAEVWQNA